MRKRTLVSLAAVCVVLGTMAPLRLAGQEGRPPSPDQDVRGRLNLPAQPLGLQRDWEYKQIWPCQGTTEGEDTANAILDEMNDLGRRGWELVSFVPVSLMQRRDCYVATFKRPLRH